MIAYSISLSEKDHGSDLNDAGHWKLIGSISFLFFQAELHLRDREGDEAVHLSGERKRRAPDGGGGAGQATGCEALALSADC